MAKKDAFIKLKDRKDNFDSHPKYRLINPFKRGHGKVSKVILDEMNNTLRAVRRLNQWRNTQSVMDLLNSIN